MRARLACGAWCWRRALDGGGAGVRGAGGTGASGDCAAAESACGVSGVARGAAMRVVPAIVLGMLVGCEGVGRAVVGEVATEPGGQLCEEPLACVSIVVEPPASVPELMEPVDLKKCTRAV